MNLANELPVHAEPPPLRADEGGAVRVGKSRVSLELVVEKYENGMTPEDLVRAYDTLDLADVHAVIAYYLRHREEVRAYLQRREEEAKALRAKIRGRALARRARGVARTSHCQGEGRCSGWPVIATTNEQSIGSAIDDILLIAEYMPEEELSEQVVVFLPFRG
jgi:uncharacterized protein (DUF433 family)